MPTAHFPPRLPKLIALDMDGTLLNAQGQIPEEFWPILERAHELDVIIAPASGRQLATLQSMFTGRERVPLSYIAENGTVVYHDGEIIDSSVIPAEAVERVLQAVADINVDFELVLCTPEVAFVSDSLGQDSSRELNKYYHSQLPVSDIHSAARENDIIKIAIYSPAGSEDHIAPVIDKAVPDQNIAVSGKAWLDIMPAGADKGRALSHMAQKLGIEIADTVAFGDYLNDYELLQAAGTAVAMDNAHPRLKEIADLIAPSNVENGVVVTVSEFFDRFAASE